MEDTTLAENREATYLGLRLAMPVLVLLLGAAIVIRIVSTGCVQPSISAYYYTPVRPVFVGVLCALGACLVLYRGRPIENAFLNFSGFLAFIVAFEPTDIGADACDVTNRPDDVAIAMATQNNVTALYVAGAVALVLGILVARRRDSSSPTVGLIPVLLTLVLAGGFAILLVAPKFFERWGHLLAAFALFGGIMAVVAYSWKTSSEEYWFRRAYAVIAVLMVVTVPVLVTDGRFKVLIVEAVLIVLFAAYWIVQTLEMDDEDAMAARGSPALSS